MKKLFIVICLCLFPLTVQAEMLNFSWVENVGDSTTGYAIVMDEGSNIVVDIPDKAVSSASYDTMDNLCHRFSIYAYNGDGVHSDVGNMISVCPKPNNVSNFTVE